MLTRYLLLRLGPLYVLLVGALVLFCIGFMRAPRTHPPAPDPTLVVGPERCAECHQGEAAQWETTQHYKTFNGADDIEAMHRRDEARAILEKLALRSAKRGVCANCHYTLQQEEGRSRARAIAGVSCESCHGPAKDWVESHGFYGEDASGAKATRATELPAHREERLAAVAASGKIGTDNLYALVENCFECHTVPNEELVNKGGHQAGSADFNYLEWLNREVKHNFLYSEGAENRAAPRDLAPTTRNRRAYVVAEMVDVAFGLQELAKATQEGPYADGLITRIQAAVAALRAIRDAAPDAAVQIDPILEGVSAASLVPNNQEALATLAAHTKAQAQAFLAAHDGTALSGVDALLP